METSDIEVKKAPKQKYCNLCTGAVGGYVYTMYLTQGNHTQIIHICTDHAEELGRSLLLETLNENKEVQE